MASPSMPPGGAEQRFGSRPEAAATWADVPTDCLRDIFAKLTLGELICAAGASCSWRQTALDPLRMRRELNLLGVRGAALARASTQQQWHCLMQRLHAQRNRDAGRCAVGVFEGLADKPVSGDFSPDGNWLLTARTDVYTAQLWSVQDPTTPPRALLGGTGGISKPFSSDSRWLITTTPLGVVRLWSIHDPAAPPRILEDDVATNRWARFSPDSQYAITGAIDHAVRVYSLKHGDAPPHTLEKVGDRYDAVDFSFDGRWVVMTVHGAVHVWPTAPSHEGPRVLGPQVGVPVSPRKRWAVASARDNSINLWSLADFGAAPWRLPRRSKASHEVFFSHDDRWVATSTGGFSATVWSTERPQDAPRVLRQIDCISSVFFSPTGNWFATETDHINQRYGASMRRWITADARMPSRVIPTPTWLAGPCALSGDGRWAVTCECDGAHSKLWTTEHPEKIPRELPGRPVLDAAAFSPDSRWLVLATDDNACVWSMNDAQRGPLTLQGHKGRVRLAMFSPEGRSIATVAADNTIRLWDFGGAAYPRRGRWRWVGSARDEAFQRVVKTSEGKVFASTLG